jgi:membrane-bound lytic murein transglycosylase D
MNPRDDNPAGVSARNVAFRRMTIRLFFALALSLSLRAFAQEYELDTNALNRVIESANEWAKENLDEDVLRSLPELDRAQVEKFLRQFQSQLDGDNVLDVAALRDAAKIVLPLLDAHDETQPYAAWLRSRLDYFDVAERLRKSAPALHLVPGQPAAPRTNPPPDAERKEWQQQLKQRDWPKAANEFVPMLKPIFAEERVPAELVWLAEVESGFNRHARSPVGAAGLFQLMPATAKRFGLSLWFRDQRYQPEPSARAAARYLHLLHKTFGDWRLALAAYNAGEGRVQRLLDRHQTHSFDHIATHLPAETQMFVPKVEATVLRREGVELGKLSVAKDVKSLNR